MGCVARIVIKDEVNCLVKGLDPGILQECQDTLTFHVPGFIHMPAYKLGRWDGKIRLFHQTGKTYVNLLDRIVPILDHHRCEIVIEDNRSSKYDHVQIALINDRLLEDYELKGKPCVLRDYQLEAVNTALEEGGGILEMATGSGKTLVAGSLSKVFEQYGCVVVIVPNIDLVVQTQYEFKSIGIDAGMWYGQIKDKKPVTIATWQSLDHFPELFHDVICVIVDEVHQAKAKVINEMLSGPACNVPFRYGCTGTMPKEDLFRLQIKAVLGNTIFTLKTWELQHKGVLADTQIYQVKLRDGNNQRYVEATTVIYEDDQGREKKEYEGFDTFNAEVNWMFADAERRDYMAYLIREIAKDHGNTLVLVTYRKHGKQLQELIPGSVSLDGRDKDRKEFYQDFNAKDNQVLICTYGIASVGIDITRIFNLVIIEPGKKFERVMQTFGRGLRKGHDKHALNVYDICSDSGMSKAHASQRRKLYNEAKQKLEVIDAEYTC